MTITLRELATGKPVGAGHVCYSATGRGWYVDNWSTGACKVYCRRLHNPSHGELFEMSPADLGLYIGHERGQPISDIKWGGKPSILAQPTAQEIASAGIRASFLEALGDYIDARVHYHAADINYRSTRDVAPAADRLEKALKDVLRHG